MDVTPLIEQMSNIKKELDNRELQLFSEFCECLNKIERNNIFPTLYNLQSEFSSYLKELLLTEDFKNFQLGFQHNEDDFENVGAFIIKHNDVYEEKKKKGAKNSELRLIRISQTSLAIPWVQRMISKIDLEPLQHENYIYSIIDRATKVKENNSDLIMLNMFQMKSIVHFWSFFVY